MPAWIENFYKNGPEQKNTILIGNKNDLVDDREIKTEEGQAFANRNGMQFIETSAKMNTNVTEAFEALAKLMMQFNSEKKPVLNKNEPKTLTASSGKDLNKKRNCC